MPSATPTTLPLQLSTVLIIVHNLDSFPWQCKVTFLSLTHRHLTYTHPTTYYYLQYPTNQPRSLPNPAIQHNNCKNTRLAET
jgi:hypothetical protein